jgi:GntR family transcriptional regulator/MocR family aminotransferase
LVKRTGGALLLSLQIDRGNGASVSHQVCSALRELILHGGLHPGERLPATRTLASDLGISRTTVVDVYERLAAEGLIESRTGAGSFVSTVLSAERPRPTRRHLREPAAPDLFKPRLARSMTRAARRFGGRITHDEPRAFTTALPAFDAFPVALWSRKVAKHWRDPRDIAMGYGDPQGWLPLRRAVAAHLRANRGIECDPGEVFIVGGAQQAFHLIASVLLDPGDKVWFENPGALGARNALIACGADLVPVPVDQQGLVVSEGERLARNLRLAFVTPSHQHPMGSLMSLERRFALLNAAANAGAMVMEDDYDGEFFYAGQPIPTLKAVDTAGHVIYVGTFSKTLFPALRLGYFVSPPALVDSFNQVTHAFLQGVPSNMQAVVADFIDEGHFATHIRRMRRLYAERQQVLCEAANRYLAGRLDVLPTDSGLNTIAYLAPPWSEEAVTEAARRRRVTVAPLSRFCLEPIDRQGLVLGFSGIRPEAIVHGVRILAEVLDQDPSLPGSN